MTLIYTGMEQRFPTNTHSLWGKTFVFDHNTFLWLFETHE